MNSGTLPLLSKNFFGPFKAGGHPAQDRNPEIFVFFEPMVAQRRYTPHFYQKWSVLGGLCRRQLHLSNGKAQKRQKK